MSKPIIFISSTILDFADLRSALYYQLTEMGYEVLVSEQNDFPVIRDKDSYTTCLKNIERCQFFILLIGSRVGGKYDDKISITRREYQIAYELTKTDKIKIIPFVRRSVWDHRERVKELASFLKHEKMNAEEINKIAYSKSHFAHDSQHIIGFINEVTHSNEMKLAVETCGERPKGNWIHIFSQPSHSLLKYPFLPSLLSLA